MLKDTDYMLSSARITAAEGKGTSAERIEAMAGAQDPDSLKNIFSDYYGISSDLDFEDMMEKSMSDAFQLVYESVPDPSVFYPIAYKYDCTNAKICIKSIIMSQDPGSILMSLSTRKKSMYEETVSTKNFAFLPDNMAKAASEALDRYSKTGDGQLIDALLDRACFCDMFDNAKKNRVKFIIEYCVTQADIANIQTAIRLSDIGFDISAGKAIFGKFFIDGGRIPMDVFATDENGLSNAENICKKMEYGPLYQAMTKIASEQGITATRIEKILDETQLHEYSKYRFNMFGAEKVALFLLTREIEIKNCRRIDSALRGKLSSQDIRQKIHLGYE